MSEPTSIRFRDSMIEISDSQGESKIDVSDLEEINEIEKYCFLKLKSGPSIILPVASMENGEACKNDLIRLAENNTIQWNEEKDWIWK